MKDSSSTSDDRPAGGRIHARLPAALVCVLVAALIGLAGPVGPAFAVHEETPSATGTESSQARGGGSGSDGGAGRNSESATGAQAEVVADDETSEGGSAANTIVFVGVVGLVIAAIALNIGIMIRNRRIRTGGLERPAASDSVVHQSTDEVARRVQALAAGSDGGAGRTVEPTDFQQPATGTARQVSVSRLGHGKSVPTTGVGEVAMAASPLSRQADTSRGSQPGDAQEPETESGLLGKWKSMRRQRRQLREQEREKVQQVRDQARAQERERLDEILGKTDPGSSAATGSPSIRPVGGGPQTQAREALAQAVRERAAAAGEDPQAPAKQVPVQREREPDLSPKPISAGGVDEGLSLEELIAAREREEQGLSDHDPMVPSGEDEGPAGTAGETGDRVSAPGSDEPLEEQADAEAELSKPRIGMNPRASSSQGSSPDTAGEEHESASAPDVPASDPGGDPPPEGAGEPELLTAVPAPPPRAAADRAAAPESKPATEPKPAGEPAMSGAETRRMIEDVERRIKAESDRTADRTLAKAREEMDGRIRASEKRQESVFNQHLIDLDSRHQHQFQTIIESSDAARRAESEALKAEFGSRLDRLSDQIGSLVQELRSGPPAPAPASVAPEPPPQTQAPAGPYDPGYVNGHHEPIRPVEGVPAQQSALQADSPQHYVAPDPRRVGGDPRYG